MKTKASENGVKSGAFWKSSVLPELIEEDSSTNSGSTECGQVKTEAFEKGADKKHHILSFRSAQFLFGRFGADDKWKRVKKYACFVNEMGVSS